MINGNPNRVKSTQIVSSPLEAYLINHHISAKAYQNFVSSILGEVVTPFSCDYDEARKESDNAYDKYPLFITYCESSADVIASIQFCKSQKLEVCARAGGHNTAGYSVLNGRMVIDVSRIKGIYVDPEAMVSHVGAGVNWGEYNHELNAWGLHNPGGSCSGVGMTGYTLGGGYGYTSMRWGIACDNLLEVTMITANGELVTANTKNHSELLWAHRGGTGGNFGIVVGLKYQLYKLKEVWPLEINWTIDEAAEVLTTWQNEMTKTLKDTKLGLLGFLAAVEQDKQTDTGEHYKVTVPYFCIRGIYSGESAEAGQKALAPLLEIGNPTYPSGPLWQNTIDYADANEHLLDNVEGVIPDTIKETKRCAYVNDPLTKQQYQKMVDYFKTSPSVYNIVSMEPYGGAINKVPANDTAFVHRNAYFDIFTDSFWMNDDEKKEAFEWLKNYYESDVMKDLWSDMYYQNYPNSEYKDWKHGYFGENYERLQKIKRDWDPKNFFNFPQSIQP